MSLPRAVAVVWGGDRVLVVKRHFEGRDYAVMPGGGVEEGESAAAAVVRELREETSLVARVDRLLWTLEHDDRTASYFLMTDVRSTPLLSGPEAEAHCSENSFELTWARLDQLDLLNLQPVEIRTRLVGGTHAS